MKKRIRKKGQGGEMIGLLVIIILLLVLVALYIRFSSKPKSTITQEAAKAVTSSNLLRAIMLYTLCEGKDFEEAVKECVKGDGPICGHQSSCQLIADEVDNILKATLKGELEGNRLVLEIKDKTVDPPESVLQVPDLQDERVSKEFKAKCKTLIFAPPQRVNLFPGIAEVKLGRCTS